jgi:hypothetical protein
LKRIGILTNSKYFTKEKPRQSLLFRLSLIHFIHVQVLHALYSRTISDVELKAVVARFELSKRNVETPEINDSLL